MNFAYKIIKSKTILLLLVFIGMSSVYIVGYDRAEFASEILMKNQSNELKLTGELIDKQQIQQNVIIPDEYTKKKIEFNIFFATYQRNNTSQLEISLMQLNTKQVVFIEANSLEDNSYEKVEFDNLNFEPGNALLQISSIGATTGNAVTMALTKDISQGTAIVDGVEELSYGLLHQEIYTVRNWDILFLGFFLCIYILIFLKVMKIGSNLNYNMLLSILIIIAITIYRLPSLTILNEIWAEGATNFYMGALENGWITNLKQLDAGYLPLLTRLITLILVKVIHVDLYFPIITQLIALIFISIFASSINLRYLKNIIPSDFLRFILGLVLGLGLFHDYELYSFINFSYLGIIPCLLIMFFNLEKTKQWNIVLLTSIFFLIVSSKAYFIVFLPFYGLLLIYHIMKKNYKSLLFYLATSISMLLQLIVVITNRATWTTQADSSNSGLIHMAFQGVSLFLKSFYYLFFKIGSSQHSILIQFILLVFLITLTLLVFYFSKKQLSRCVMIFVVSTQILALLSIGLSLSVPYVKDSTVWVAQFSVPYNRHFIFSNIFIFVGIFVWVTNLIESTRKQWFMGALIILAYSFSGFNFIDRYEYENYSYSNWQDFYSEFEAGGCAPVNPYPWIICESGTNDFPVVAITEPVGTQSIDINTIMPESNTWIVNGLLLDKTNPWNRKIIVILYDKENQPIGEAIESSLPTNRYGYFKFDKDIQVSRIKFFDENYNEVMLFNPQLTFFGTP